MLNLTFFLLFLFVLFSFVSKNKWLLIALLGLTHLVAYLENIENFTGFIFMVIFSCLIYISYLKNFNFSNIKFIFKVCILLLIYGFFLHKIPGYHNVLVMSNIKLKLNSTPFSLYLNFDKTMAASSLFVFSSLSVEEKKIDLKSFLWTLVICFVSILLILYPAHKLKFIHYNFKIDQYFPLWAFNNLFFTCFAEEVAFRGFLQKQMKLFISAQWQSFASLFLSAFFFALLHYTGGLSFMFFALVAGLFYGLTYEKTNRLSCTIFIHFILNLTHFIFFTYPSVLKIHS